MPAWTTSASARLLPLSPNPSFTSQLRPSRHTGPSWTMWLLAWYTVNFGAVVSALSENAYFVVHVAASSLGSSEVLPSHVTPTRPASPATTNGNTAECVSAPDTLTSGLHVAPRSLLEVRNTPSRLLVTT